MVGIPGESRKGITSENNPSQTCNACDPYVQLAPFPFGCILEQSPAVGGLPAGMQGFKTHATGLPQFQFTIFSTCSLGLLGECRKCKKIQISIGKYEGKCRTCENKRRKNRKNRKHSGKFWQRVSTTFLANLTNISVVSTPCGSGPDFAATCTRHPIHSHSQIVERNSSKSSEM